MFNNFNKIPGVTSFQSKTDLPVLLPYQARSSGDPLDLRFSRWLASSSPWLMFALFLLVSLYPMAVMAQSKYTLEDAFSTLWRWLPFVVGSGFVMNLLISFFTMLIGTATGILLGLGQISLLPPVRKLSWFLPPNFFAIPPGWYCSLL